MEMSNQRNKRPPGRGTPARILRGFTRPGAKTGPGKTFFFLCLSALLPAFALGSCRNSGDAPESGAAAGAPAAAESSVSSPGRVSGVSAPADASASARPPEEGARRAILIRGNCWTPGVPGFGPNGFSALAGEYRIDGPETRTTGEEAEKGFSVFLTGEPLYFSGEWEARQGAGSMRVFHREGDEGYLAAALLDDGQGSSWTALFQFPRGLAEAGLDDTDFGPMLAAWARRFVYFLSLSKTPGELSLPAVLEF